VAAGPRHVRFTTESGHGPRNPFVMERSQRNFLFRPCTLAKASAASGTVTPAVALETLQRSRYNTGAGPREGFDVMNTQELAKAFTDLCAKGELEAAGKKFWSDDIVSREPMTGDMAELKGRKAVEGKGEWWKANHEVHSFKVKGPYVHGDQFVVRFEGEVTPKGQKRMHVDEVGLYTVRNGKIVEESFFMGGA
jgi:ketosteroid isomerase-like protein